MENEMRTLLVEDWDGTFELTVPVKAKVTFGPSIPQATARGRERQMPFQGNPGRRMEYALRVYNGETEKSGLLAIYTGVHGFRDATCTFIRTQTRSGGVMIGGMGGQSAPTPVEQLAGAAQRGW